MPVSYTHLRLKESIRLSEEKGISVELELGYIENAHPNTARILLEDAKGNKACVQGSSIGGGNILITKINDMDVEITGQHQTLIILHRDTMGVIAAVAECIKAFHVNICNFRLSRKEKGGMAVMTIEADGNIEAQLKQHIEQLPYIHRCILLKVN